MFNVQKENIEPASVKLSEPKPKFVLLASPTIKQPSIYELMSRKGVTFAEIQNMLNQNICKVLV